jgi:serine/threonine-protein kinase
VGASSVDGFPHDIPPDGYTVEREIGRGGMATVYAVRDTKHGRRVALKVLRPELAASLGAERFRREITLVSSLQHPHIVSVYDSGETPCGALWFTMPLIEGESLRDRLRRQHELSVDEAMRITREVALALDYAHRHGVIHRDIKPENILLVDGQAMVADFGVARALVPPTPAETLTATGVAIGTPAYMSPEQAAGERLLDAATDIYSLGAVCSEMLTGEPPLLGPTAHAVAAQIMSGDVPSIRRVRARVPEPVEEAVRKALASVPADRYATAADFAKALETAERTALVSGSGAPAKRVRRRFPSVAAVTFGLVALVGASLFWGARQRNTPAAAQARIAVLPFENLGASDDDYFAEGMTDELTSRLSKMSGLAVIARMSAIQYKKTAKAVPLIGRELGADYLIEGTVRWEKQPNGTGRVRITPQLVRAKDGTHVWADEYDKPYGAEIFDMQSDIAERVANALSVTLLATEQKAVRAVPTQNLQAYDYFLRGQAYSMRDVSQDWEAERLALESYQKALEVDPRFALAYAWAADTHLRMYVGVYDAGVSSGVSLAQRRGLAKQAAENALEIDPKVPHAHAVLGNYYMNAIGDTTRALYELSLATRGDPSDPEAVADRGQALFDMGYPCRAMGDTTRRTAACAQQSSGIADLERAVSLDPRNPRRMTAAMKAAIFAGDFPKAEAYVDRAIAVAPDLASAYVYKTKLNYIEGRPDSARAALREGVRQAGVAKVLFTTAKDSYTDPYFRYLGEEYRPAAEQLSWETFGSDSVDYYVAKANLYLRDPVRGRAYFDSLAIWSARHVRGEELDPLFHIAWAWGLAGSGRQDAAVREINRLLGDKRYNWWPLGREMTAEACVLARQYDCAMQQLQFAKIEAWVVSAPLLRADPIWDPLRGRADFQKLLEETRVAAH